MALDPTIALGIKPAEPFDITKFQQLRNLAMQEQATAQSIAASQAQEQLARAQLSGVQAESDVRVRTQRFNTDVLGNAKEFTNADGSPNITKFINFATEKGFLKEAQAIAASDLENLGKALANARSEQDIKIGQANFARTAGDYSALLLHNTPEEQRPQALQVQADFMNKLVPGSGDQIIKQYASVDPKTGMLKVNADAVKAARTATINAATQETQAAEFAQRFLTPEGRDPNSKLNVDFRAYVEAQTGGAVKLPTSFTLDKAGNIPTLTSLISGYTQANIVPGSVRAQATVAASEYGIQLQRYDQALDAISKMPPQMFPTKVGSFLEEQWKSKVKQDPAFAAMQTAIQVYNQEFPDNPIQFPLNPEEIKAKLGQGRATVQIRLEAKQKQAAQNVLPTPESERKPTERIDPATQAERDRASLQILTRELSTAVASGRKEDIEGVTREINRLRQSLKMAPIPIPQAAPAPTPATSGLIRMINKSGKVINVHPSREAEAKAAGYRRAEK